MPEIILEGDWPPEKVDRITTALRKSLSMADGAEETLQTSIVPADQLLSPRQKKLLKQWQESPQDWDAYLNKGVGSIKVTPKGTYRMNANNRWERLPQGPIGGGVGDFEFPERSGQYGWGVYMPVAATAGPGLKLRAQLNISENSVITDEEFEEYAADLNTDTDYILDARSVKAIVVTEDELITELIVRHTSDIQILGIIPNSGQAPTGEMSYRIVSVDRQPDRILVDIELTDNSKTLEKSAKSVTRSTLQSQSYLNGTNLIRTSAPKLDRGLVRAAIERCKLDGVALNTIQVHCLNGVPDFLSRMTAGFCLPSDGVVNLCPHDPQAAISYLGSQLADRLKTVVNAGAMPGTEAIDILERALKLTPEWWLEMLIKRMVGAIVLERKFNVIANGTLPIEIRDNLVSRGMVHWGVDRRRVLEALAEDYRCAHDPAGLPNLVSLEWDILLPNFAMRGRSYAASIGE